MTAVSLPIQTAAIVSTGTEILQGLYADTNARYLAEQLTAVGVRVVSIMAAPDDEAVVERAIVYAAQGADLVVCTGGLGPTEDDVNRYVFARAWGATLYRDERAVEMMRDRFVARARGPMPESNEVQALLPEGCVPLYNEWGTAPGFYLPRTAERAALLALPGPPKEMQPMFQSLALPLLTKHIQSDAFTRVRTIRTYGQPESFVNDRCRDLFKANPKLDVTILAKTYGVDLRVLARTSSADEGLALLDELEQDVRGRLGPFDVYGVDEETLASAVAKELIAQQLTISAAESCTGGLLAKLLTDIPGSSAYLHQSHVVYGNEAKVSVAGVSAQTLADHGAVSELTARELAVGVRSRSGADIGVGITGIAGPTGGSEAKPVGLTYIAVADAAGCVVERVQFLGDREMNRLWAAQSALHLVWKRLRNRGSA